MTKYPKLDDLREKEGISNNNKNVKHGLLIFGKVFLILFIICAIMGALFSYKLIVAENDKYPEDENASIFQQIKRLVLSRDKELRGESEGRTNILLLGMGGEGHSGALLTDTIMLISVKYNKDDDQKDVSMISIPRDLYVPIGGGEDYYRINSVYAIGESSDNYENGSQLIGDTINEITGIPIHYYIRANFDGFQEIIDSLGGVDVYVDRGFYDSEYPDNNFGYQTVVFKKGMNKMDGDQALKFVRSRHGVVVDGEGSEASDFARASRQQKVLEAVRSKALSINTLFNPSVIADTLGVVGDNIRTNLEPWEMLKLAEFAKEVNQEEIINKVIDHSQNGFLYSTIASSGAYVLLPNKEDYSEIRDFVKNIFDIKYIKYENAKIEVLNGTPSTGHAQFSANHLSFEEYNIVSYGNATGIDTPIDKTIIYTLGDQKKDVTLARLKEKYNNCEIRKLDNRYDIVDPETTEELNVDIIIVLGTDSIYTKN